MKVVVERKHLKRTTFHCGGHGGQIPTEPGELWATVPMDGHEDYLVSTKGRVCSLKGRTPRILKPQRGSGGYRQVGLVAQGSHVGHTFRIAPLVMLAFVGPTPDGLVIRHGPNGQSDDSLDNLCFGTQKENMEDKKRDGTNVGPIGTVNGMARLIEDEAIEIIKIGDASEASARFGISKRQARDIIAGKAWKHLPRDLPVSNN